MSTNRRNLARLVKATPQFVQAARIMAAEVVHAADNVLNLVASGDPLNTDVTGTAGSGYRTTVDTQLRTPAVALLDAAITYLTSSRGSESGATDEQTQFDAVITALNALINGVKNYEEIVQAIYGDRAGTGAALYINLSEDQRELQNNLADATHHKLIKALDALSTGVRSLPSQTGNRVAPVVTAMNNLNDDLQDLASAIDRQHQYIQQVLRIADTTGVPITAGQITQLNTFNTNIDDAVTAITRTADPNATPAVNAGTADAVVEALNVTSS